MHPQSWNLQAMLMFENLKSESKSIESKETQNQNKYNKKLKIKMNFLYFLVIPLSPPT